MCSSLTLESLIKSKETRKWILGPPCSSIGRGTFVAFWFSVYCVIASHLLPVPSTSSQIVFCVRAAMHTIHVFVQRFDKQHFENINFHPPMAVGLPPTCFYSQQSFTKMRAHFLTLAEYDPTKNWLFWSVQSRLAASKYIRRLVSHCSWGTSTITKMKSPQSRIRIDHKNGKALHTS